MSMQRWEVCDKSKVLVRLVTFRTNIYIYIYIYILMGPLPTNSWTLTNSILIECQVLSWILDTLPIFDWQVSLSYATTFLCILLLQYIFKLIPCSELSFRGPNQGQHYIYIYIYIYMSVCLWVNVFEREVWRENQFWDVFIYRVER